MYAFRLCVVNDLRRGLQSVESFQRALQHYRTTGVIPYSSLGNRIVFREADIARILQANFIPAEKR